MLHTENLEVLAALIQLVKPLDLIFSDGHELFRLLKLLLEVGHAFLELLELKAESGSTLIGFGELLEPLSGRRVPSVGAIRVVGRIMTVMVVRTLDLLRQVVIHIEFLLVAAHSSHQVKLASVQGVPGQALDDLILGWQVHLC